MEITYDSIKPLIFAEETDGPMIKLKFKAKNQDTPLETIAYVAIGGLPLASFELARVAHGNTTGLV